MSGNNPHGHLSQPQNSSWNPLQIPSYIPRQPQLAHMSNERPMVRSPLAWHTPTPPDAIYNYISANHKNLDQLNPLLPSFVRGPSPFDSMDLSLQSNRNSSSPLTKGLSASGPPEFGHKPPPPPPPSHSQNNFPIHNLSTNSNVHHSQSMSTAPPPPVPKYMNANGNDVEMQQQACGLYVRDTDRINDDYAKMANRSCENDIQSNMAKPVELVKECSYANLSNKLIPNSPKKISPPPNQQQTLQQQQQQQQFQHQLQQQYSCNSNGPNSPENNRLAHLSNFNAPLNHLLLESTSGTCLPPKCGTDLTTATAAENSCNSLSTNDSPANVTSNEDSVDSSGSRTRRKRKPNKTVRMSHDSDVEENISLAEQAIHVEKPTTPPPLSTIAEVSNTNGSIPLQSELLPEIPTQESEKTHYKEQGIQDESKSTASPRKSPLLASDNLQTIKDVVDCNDNQGEAEGLDTTQLPRADSDEVETIDKIAEMIAKSSNSCILNPEDSSSGNCDNIENKQDSMSPAHLSNSEGDKVKSPGQVQQTPPSSEPPILIDEVPADSTDQSNDLKIILEKVEDPPLQATSQKLTTSSPSPPQSQTTVATVEEELAMAPKEEKTFAEIPPVPVDNKPSDATSTFEEVEYKLEEMFAGIEDEPPAECPAPLDDSANNESTDLSLALSLPTVIIPDDPEELLDVIPSSSNSTQKRTHSTSKSESSPPKKKSRLTKKASNKKLKKKIPASHSSGVSKGTPSSQGNKTKSGPSCSGSGGSSGSSTSGANGTALTASGSTGNKSIAVKAEESSQICLTSESRYKGPYILVKPDGSTNIVNTPTTEDDLEKVNKVKKGTFTNTDRSKIRGMHISTLSNKYDADTTDASWMCVFCKKGPHKFDLGDLFGPYIVSTNCEDFEASERDELNENFTNRRKKSDMYQKTPYSLPAVPAGHSVLSNNKKKKKISESHSVASNDSFQTDKFFGMSKVSDTNYEVWMHEDCAVWAPGVFVVGARVSGLESSVWTCTTYTCSVCSQKGAMVCCLERGCGQYAHIPCARFLNWYLNETDFKTYCEKHTKSLHVTS